MPYTDATVRGKFEGNDSEWVAEVLYEFCANGAYSEELGDVQTYGWAALIKGKRWWFIVDEDSNGFFDYTAFEPQKAQKMWDSMLEDYEAFLKEE